LSPAAGNGVVVFSPALGLYTSYFHLSSTGLQAGDIVEAGSPIGKGGNSGMNARRRGHGGHLHLEVFDARRGAHLTCYELYDLLKGL
jgi:murein DD-endopeptidase MepM/ murein hydrolase activator NlpD